MLYEFSDNIPDIMCYWSNSLAELSGDIVEDDLPTELKRVLGDLWTDAYVVRCYLFEFYGRYGVALEAEYEADYARDLGISPDTLEDYAHSIARAIADRYSKYDVVFCDKLNMWGGNTDDNDSLVTVFMPWDIDKEEFVSVAKWFEGNCYLDV